MTFLLQLKDIFISSSCKQNKRKESATETLCILCASQQQPKISTWTNWKASCWADKVLRWAFIQTLFLF